MIYSEWIYEISDANGGEENILGLLGLENLKLCFDKNYNIIVNRN